MINDFSKVSFKTSYDSGTDDLLNEFYVPVLSLANSYDRVAGFFSSASFAIAARGLQQFIMNHGKMRLVTCPKLQAADIRMIEQGEKGLDQIMVDAFINDFGSIEEKFMRDHVKALGWMLANGYLEIRIAVMKKNGRLCTEQEINDSGIMHQKVGIFYDQCGNIVSFSGSNNESASGWLYNSEEFKAFCSWDDALKYIQPDIDKFDSFWNNTRRDCEVKKLSDALKEKLIEISSDFEPNDIAINKYNENRHVTSKRKLTPYVYQDSARNDWNNNGRRILLEMATGTGKTITALGCLNELLNEKNRLLTVIACPQTTLAQQWKSNVDGFDMPIQKEIEVNGDISGWNVILVREITKLKAGRYKNLIIYVTHALACDEKFTAAVSSCGSNIKKFLIGDEVHGMGSGVHKRALIDAYDYRLGLSATPRRWFDDYGTKMLMNYFGNKTYEFSIMDALTRVNPRTGKTFLVNFNYHPKFIHLTDGELSKYQRLTQKIAKSSWKIEPDETGLSPLDRMRFERANIEKSAENKYGMLEKILDEIGNGIMDTIIFVSPDQIDKVMDILKNRGIMARRFTEKEGTSPSDEYNGLSERQHIIKMFTLQKYKVLVAIKCLDEGIDIPSASRAIIMASSTNPREYVQRIGRVIRQDNEHEKYKADIYDMIIQPDLSAFHDDGLAKLEVQIFRKEMDRVEELSGDAINNISVYKEVKAIEKEVLNYD